MPLLSMVVDVLLRSLFLSRPALTVPEPMSVPAYVLAATAAVDTAVRRRAASQA